MFAPGYFAPGYFAPGYFAGQGIAPVQPVLVANRARTITLTHPRATDAAWDIIEPDMNDVFTLDFSCDVGPNVLATSATWTCSVIDTMTGATPDPFPETRLIGTANVTTGPKVGTGATRTFTNQAFGNNAFAGNLYLLHATVQTSDNRVLSGYGHVWCMAPN